MALADNSKERDARAKPQRGRQRRVKQDLQKTPGASKRRSNPAPDLWAKAHAAARAARLLSEAGDWNGAANRAYYAAFSAARAVLASVRAQLADSKGHGTIVRRLEKHLIQERGLDRSFGRAFFGGLSHARWVADYDTACVGEGVAHAMVEQAERFLVAVEPFLKKAKT